MVDAIAQFGDHVVFCRGCGQLAGTPTKCLASGWRHYEFVTRPAGIYVCRGCGATIGPATK